MDRKSPPVFLSADKMAHSMNDYARDHRDIDVPSKSTTGRSLSILDCPDRSLLMPMPSRVSVFDRLGYSIHWQGPISGVNLRYIYGGAKEIGSSRASGWDINPSNMTQIIDQVLFTLLISSTLYALLSIVGGLSVSSVFPSMEEARKVNTVLLYLYPLQILYDTHPSAQIVISMVISTCLPRF